MSTKAIGSWKDSTKKDKEIFVAAVVKKIHPVMHNIVNQLLAIDLIQFVRVTNTDIQASNKVTVKGRTKTPISTPGHSTAVGVHLIIEPSEKTVQFFELTSAVKGYGVKIVQTVMASIPCDWEALVIMDYSYGFWDKMVNQYDKISIL